MKSKLDYISKLGVSLTSSIGTAFAISGIFFSIPSVLAYLEISLHILPREIALWTLALVGFFSGSKIIRFVMTSYNSKIQEDRK